MYEKKQYLHRHMDFALDCSREYREEIGGASLMRVTRAAALGPEAKGG